MHVFKLRRCGSIFWQMALVKTILPTTIFCGNSGTTARNHLDDITFKLLHPEARRVGLVKELNDRPSASINPFNSARLAILKTVQWSFYFCLGILQVNF